MNQPVLKIVLGLVAATLLGPWVANAQTAGAAAPPLAPPTSYSVQPDASQAPALIKHGYFTLTLTPGQTKTVYLVVTNTGKQVLHLGNYAAAATQIAAGGIDFGTRTTQLEAAGTWIVVKPKNIVLAPGTSQRVSATFTVPKHLKTGDYVGGVALENLSVQQQGAGSHLMVAVHYRKVIAILESVPGTLISSAIIGKVGLAPSLSTAQSAVYLQASSSNKPVLKGSVATVVVKNTGNVLWKGTGILHIGGLNNGTSVPFTVDTILVHSSASIGVQMPALDLLPGLYNMSVTLQSAVKSAPIKWSGLVGLTLPVAAAAATAVPNLALQPAHPAAAGTATVNQGSPVSTTSSSQSISLVLFGGGAVVLIILGIGLGVVLSRRSSGRPHPPVALPLVR